MNTRDYRICENIEDCVEGSRLLYCIKEVYYDNTGSIDYIEPELQICEYTTSDLRNELVLMIKAFEKPVIEYEDYRQLLEQEVPF